MAAKSVLLVNMPFARRAVPSIGLSLLKAGLCRVGVPCQIAYYNVEFARRIGGTLYDMVTERGGHGDLVGEWMFSDALFDSAALDADGYVNGILSNYPKDFADSVVRLRGDAGAWLDACCDDVLRRAPAIVGLTSMFQQHVPALALAKRIKAASPGTPIVLGGANCEGPMGIETARQFPYVDAVVSGEADLVFPALVERLLSGRPVEDLPGVYGPRRPSLEMVGARVNAPRVEDMDALPYPDYDDFFEAWRSMPTENGSRVALEILFETSRGCWWGEKHHCTFCGLSDDVMKFRAKSSERALSELTYLIDRHGCRNVGMVDNILAMKSFKDFVPELGRRGLGATIFYELKANVKKEHVRLLRDAGITSIQPGIESFSTRLLQRMRKGVTALQNVQALKWCEEFGLTPCWLILWGFPGETAEEYAQMAELVPLLMHLHPPAGAMPIRLERFSPNYEDAGALGFRNVAPHESYRYIYPFAPRVLANLAYFFAYEYAEPQDVATYTAPLKEKIAEWKAAYPDQALVMDDDRSRDELRLIDTRTVARRRETRLRGLARTVYLACDGIASVGAVADVAIARHGPQVARPEVESILAGFVEDRLMIREGDNHLALAIDAFEKAALLKKASATNG